MSIRLCALALAGLLTSAVAEAKIVSGTWFYNIFIDDPGAPIEPVTGTLTFSGLDTTQDHSASTAAGFAFTVNLPTPAGGVAFNYDRVRDELEVGTLAYGISGLPGGKMDWWFTIREFAAESDRTSLGPPISVFYGVADTGDFSSPIYGGRGFLALQVVTPPPAGVPEPATAALLGFGLLAVRALARRQPRSGAWT